MILGVRQAERAGVRIYQNLPNFAKVGSSMIIILFLKGELNKTAEDNNTDVNRNMEEKVIKRNIGRNGGKKGKEQNDLAQEYISLLPNSVFLRNQYQECF